MKLSKVFLVLFALLILDAAIALGQQQQEQHQQEQHQQEQQQQGQNPFVFEQSHFQTRFQEQHGRIRVLPRFSQRSEILRGIDNYRISVLEAEPNTFFVPNHLDAEVVVIVRQGNGAVSLLLENNRESFDIRTGDIFRVPAGIAHYIVNKDNNQKLILVELVQPVANPGQYERFFGAGAESPESSFYKAFSNEVLEAVFQGRESEISRIFGPKRRGVFVGASQEQIRELGQHRGSGLWPFGRQGQSQRTTFNILEKRPSQENQFGQLREANNNDYQPLQDLNVAVSFANINRGGMKGPVYNSKAWTLAVILSEDGYVELAHPQSQSQSQEQRQGQSQGQSQEQSRGSSRSEQERQQGEPRYERVSAQLRQNTVVVVPPGHPAVFVASQNRNLEIIAFEINAIGNQKIPLAGRGNVYNQLENVAKGLAFGAPGREVEELFNRNKEQLFFRGPQQQPRQQQGGGGEGELKMVV